MARAGQSFLGAERRRWLGLQIIFGVICGGLVLMSGACTRQDAPVPASANAALWSWERYPLDSVLPVVRVDAEVRAEFSNRFYAPASGRVQLIAKGSEPALAKDTLWAVFSPDVLKLGEDMLIARRALLKARQAMLNQVDIPQKRLEVEKRLREARHLKEMALRLGNDEAAWKALSELVPEAGLEEADRSPEALDRTITILTQELAFLNGENGGNASADLQVAEVELRQAEIEQALKRTQYEMRMPFTGKLVCNLEVRAGQEDYPVTSGQLIGLARREDALSCEVRMQDARWLGIPAEMLFLRTRLADGREIKLPFAGRRIREQMGAEVLYYVFNVPGGEVPALRPNIDSMLPGELCQQLEKPARIVPKIMLLTARPAEFGLTDWTAGVTAVWPQARLAGVGGTMVAIEPMGAQPK